MSSWHPLKKEGGFTGLTHETRVFDQQLTDLKSGTRDVI